MKNLLFIGVLLISTLSFTQNLQVCKTSFNNQGESWCDSTVDLNSFYSSNWDTLEIQQLDELSMYVSVEWIQFIIAHEDLTGSGADAIFNINSNPVPSFEFTKLGLHRIKISTPYDGLLSIAVNVTSSEFASIDELDLNLKAGSFEFYNLMGQKLENPTGLCLKVYESGYSEKVYK